jgi:hypothetical protein
MHRNCYNDALRPELFHVRWGTTGDLTGGSFIAFGELSLDPLNRSVADAHLPRRLPDTAAFF